jgi:hypothetical protein
MEFGDEGSKEYLKKHPYIGAGACKWRCAAYKKANKGKDVVRQ